MIKYIPIFLAAFLCAPTLNAKELTLLSPDGRNKVTFSKPDKELTYTVAVDGKEVILPSRAGLDVDNWAWATVGKSTIPGIRSTANVRP